MSATPLLQQYFSVKEQYPGVLLLFQVGDFYEMFFEDAVKAAAFLGITLTKRGTLEGKPVPLCGVPVHALDHYLVKLIKGGFRVALCDQLSQPVPGKIVERGVTKVLTPGTLTDIKLLQEKSASYCATLFPLQESCGAVFVELLTGQLFCTVFPLEDRVTLEAELRRFMPDELVLPQTSQGEVLEGIVRRLGYVTTHYPWMSEVEGYASWVDGFSSTQAFEMVRRSDALFGALSLLYAYVKKNQERALSHCTQLFFYAPHDYLVLDAATQRNLELVCNTVDGSSSSTLFSVLDRAVTSMGSRMIKKWLVRPLVKKELIVARHDVVELLIKDFQLRERLVSLYKDLGDFERVVGRIVLRRAYFFDYQVLGRSLDAVERIKQLFSSAGETFLMRRAVEGIADFKDLKDLLMRALNDDPDFEGKIKLGFDPELDRLRLLMREGTHAIARFEVQERLKTGIASLKVKFNRSFGYALEVTKANRELVPSHYQRIQTLTNGERFTTDELKQLEYDCSHAQRAGEALESEIFARICEEVESYGIALKRAAQQLAQGDALLGLARAAYDEGFCRPVLHEGRDISISAGRHPVVASALKAAFIPNDLALTDKQSTWIITGPNMGGKSTFLRQVALIVIMAQVGSFIPAAEANLPLIDRIFTRIGSADNLAAGKSTFLVEMEETALICNRATERSLVILDEVGRGTSTTDGLAIAQAVVEYLHTNVCARALFATHFHELTALVDHFPGMVAYHAASSKTGGEMVLLHKIVPGKALGSFGIEVARQVDLPRAIIERALILVQDSLSSDG